MFPTGNAANTSILVMSLYYTGCLIGKCEHKPYYYSNPRWKEMMYVITLPCPPSFWKHSNLFLAAWGYLQLQWKGNYTVWPLNWGSVRSNKDWTVLYNYLWLFNKGNRRKATLAWEVRKVYRKKKTEDKLEVIWPSAWSKWVLECSEVKIRAWVD